MLTILYCALLLSAWISCPLANIDVRQCPSRFQRTEGICIAIEPSKGYTFEEAQSACASKGNNAHLLKIGKESVFNYLKNNVVNNGNDVWLGAVLKNDGGFEWLDSTKCCDPYWLPGEPNNNGGAPNCVNIYRPGNNAGLNDDHCSERKGFVCEIKECTVISNCETPNCTWYGDTKCSKCYDDNIFFKKTTNDTLCERLCDHDSHLCWPGTCRSGLKKNCVCAPQFDLNTNVTSTLCQLNKNQTATIETCATTVYSEKGDAFQSRGNSSSTECQFRGNFFGNIQPRRLVYTFVSSFKVNLTAFGTIPPYIQETRFGTLTIIKKDLGGSETTLLAEHILIDNNQSQNAKELFTKNDNISIPNTTLVDGQMLCVVYEANSGGYLKSKNMFTSQHIISAAKPYRKRTSSKRICYKYDAGKPKHCAEFMNCRMEPLQLAERITKNPLINVSFNGWTDPFPSGGNQSHASGIESFEVYVHEVVPPNGTLSSIVFSKKVNNAESSISLNFTSDLPKLYCITLETKDFANNVQRARRFVLYDNFSSLNTSYKNLFQITSASSAEPYAWQNHHSDVCLDWKGYFYNTFFRDNELLNSIQPDRLIEVDSIYDQTEGVLPVSGTPNIAGILGFVFHWTRHRQFHENTTGSDIVPNFENQQFCKALDMEDGDTFYMQIEALDVVNNSLGSNRTLFIDRTAPQIVNINLLKNGVTQLFVYDSTDLSGMILFFKTYDSHSGIRNMKWSFGKSDTREELLNGTLGAKYVNESYNCTSGADACYCPMIGKCEHFNYTVDLNKLHILGTHMGNHNRNYYFTLTATNNAGLSNTESIDILVDDSPPEPGVVFEGPVDGNDIDYTSDNSFIVHWFGFIDHESDINMYRIAVSKSCLTADDLESPHLDIILQYKEIPSSEQSVVMNNNHTGKVFTTIVAYNNAMEPSKAVCSDGITRDRTPPQVKNIRVRNSKWRETLLCNGTKLFFLTSNMEKIQLSVNDFDFHRSCSRKNQSLAYSSAINQMIESLPSKIMKNDGAMSAFILEHIPLFNPEEFAFIPNDHIHIDWEMEDDESQINDFYVGIARYENVLPSVPTLIDYQPTHRNTYFSFHHAGVGSNEPFYLLLKSVNKANLQSTTTIGPFIIDNTPPEYNTIPSVEIDDKFINISWSNDTFYDDEQRSPIQTIFFQFGHDDVTVTPLLEWTLDQSKKCVHGDFCFSIPLSKLQYAETEQGVFFYANVYLYNIVGHSRELQSSLFQLPSMYPPGKGHVIDIDPNVIDIFNKEDVAIHFTPHKLCAHWHGFHHHENISYTIGIGSKISSADIVGFVASANTSFACIYSEKILPDTLYYFHVKASCSGGTISSISNGVVIIDYSLQIYDIQHGLSNSPCHALNYVTTYTNGQSQICLVSSVSIGRSYTVHLHNTDITSTAFRIPGKLLVIDRINNETRASFITYVENPCLTIMYSPTPVSVLAFEPNSNDSYINGHDRVCLRYSFPDIMKNIEGYVQYSIIERTCYGISNTTCIESTRPFQILTNNTVNELQKNYQYRSAIRICNQHRCSSTKESRSVDVDFDIPFGEIYLAQIEEYTAVKGYKLTAQWKQFHATSGIALYKWFVSDDMGCLKQITNLSTVSMDKHNLEIINITVTVELPVNKFRSLFYCVRAYSNVGRMYTASKSFALTTAPITDSVYDFDCMRNSWIQIEKLLESYNLGSRFSFLHDEEVTFGQSNSKMVGAIFYNNARLIKWYLMKERRLPLSDCALDISCVATETNKNSYVHFSKDVIFENTYYYICVKTERINVTLEHSVEYLQPIRACSNGFVVDTIPPSDGFVNVTSSSGYITGNEVEISWHGFKDNVDAKLFGYPSYIQFYAYQVGTRRGSGDIQPFRDAGRNERLTYELNDLFLDGMALYFTVKAFDYSGLSSSSMSEEVIIDRSPPSVGRVVIERDDRSIVYVTSDFFTANVHGFEDIHSGIKNFEISIGSKSDIENIAQKIVFRNEIVNIDGTGLFIDGHVYFLFAKAVNRAGLQSVAAVATFVVDRTPPEGGYVLDGHWNQSIDLDFQINMHQIVCHWTGFIDIESGISHFIVGLGSNPGEDDIEPMLHVGLQNDYSWNSSFSAGQIYFCSVTVCNKAGLCLSKSSDGILLDNSPPIAGVVRVGLFEKHLHFQSQSTNAHIFWAGFEDPQSGIHHFELCLGTVIELCDLVPYFDTLLHSNIIKTGIDLPINRRLYASVIAFNRVGLNATRSSDYFIIDTTKPIVRMAPSFLHGNSMKLQNTSAVSFEKSKLHVVWKFEDRESTIIQHILTLKTHNEGHTPLDNIKLGQYDSFAITFDKNNWLHNGDRYWVVVTCCNAAGLCTSANSSDILIDSTPPHTGGFLPTMSWNNLGTSGDALSNVSLSWYGFLDQESGIEKYYVSASSSFSGQELTKGVLTFRPNTNTHERINFLSDKYIYPNDKLILTIWAQNFAGLNSSAAKVTTIATSETPTKNISDQRGFLSIEKHSCDIHYCDSTCTCSLFNKPCTDAVNYKCVSNNSIDTNIHVSFISENGIIDSSACLAVQWNFTDINPKPFIKRFEWSVGETDSAIGYGIFDLKLEKPWFDVGLNTRGVYCLPTGKNLDPGKHYTAYVKAWFESDMYKIYSSTPIIVDQTAPSVKKLHFVKDSTSDCAKDLDYIDWTDKITACWHDVFQEPQGHIKGYYVSLGPVINGSDVFNNTYVGLYQNLTFSDLDLHSGTRYYITVTAINNIHRRKTAHSDGFVVDTDNPLEGIVFNTKHHVDEHFQSNGDTFSLSWHGFIDHSSGVKAYHVAVIDVDAMQTHVNFINVALKTTHTFQNATLSHGHKYTGLVKAEDAAGHFSKIVHSTPKHIDFSPPIGYTCAQYRPLNNKLLTVSQYTTTEFSSTFLKHVPYAIRGLVSNDNTEVAVRIGRLNSPLALVKNHNGTYAFKYAFTLPMEMKTNIYLEFDIKRETNISVGVYECMDMGEATHGVVTVSQVRKSMFIVSVNVFDPDSGIKKITLGAGTSPGSLQLRSWNVAHCVNDEIMDLQVQHGTPVHVTAIVENYAGHKSVFNSTAVVTDITPPEISNVIFNIETYINISGNTSTISSTITGQWNVIDNETDIKQCSVGIGRSSYGSPNIVPYTYVNDTMVTFHLNSNAHGDVLYGVVKCVNNVELTTLAASGALIVAYEKPNIDLAQVQFIAEAIAAVPFSDLPNKFHTISYSNRSSSNEKIFVQNNLTALKVEWDGIADAAGLNNYEYRVMTSEGVTVNWTDCGNYTFVDITGLNLKPEAIYAVQIRATNLAHATSDDIQTYTFPKGSAPQLTGNDARITLSHNNITLDWSDVFEEHFLISPMNTYDVVVGTRAGNNDVIDLSKKKETTIQFLKPKSSLTNSIPTEIFVVIICWDANGQFGVYQTRLQLDRK